MKASRPAFVRATLAMLGTIIGAGVFAVPLAMRGPGILVGSLFFWGIALVILATHLLYVEVILNDTGMLARRLPGQASRVLGRWAGRLAFVTHPLQIIGACLAYLILGGEFLSILAGFIGLPTAPLLWQVVFWFGGAITVYVGLKFVAKIEGWMTWGLITLLLVTTALFMHVADGRLFLQADWSQALAPLGVFLFSLFGLPVVSEVVTLCERDRQQSRLAVAAGSLSAALLTWLFGVFALAAIGSGAISNPTDIMRALPSSVFWIIPAVGFLAVASSFITLTQDLKAMFQLDAKFPKLVSWALALIGPLVLLFLINRDFLGTVGFVGSIFGSINGFLVAVMAFKLRSAERRRSAWWFVVPSVAMLVFLGVFIWRIMNLIP